MSRHSQIFIGIFCWMTALSFVVLAVVNGVASPPQSVGVAIFACLAAVTALIAYLLTRPPRAI